jgi:hypothetical protein
MIEPVLLDPEALYDDGSLRQALGLTPTTLAAGRRSGTLRYTRQGKRTLYLGKWILAWLEAAASTPHQTTASPVVSTTLSVTRNGNDRAQRPEREPVAARPDAFVTRNESSLTSPLERQSEGVNCA